MPVRRRNKAQDLPGVSDTLNDKLVVLVHGLDRRGRDGLLKATKASGDVHSRLQEPRNLAARSTQCRYLCWGCRELRLRTSLLGNLDLLQAKSVLFLIEHNRAGRLGHPPAEMHKRLRSVLPFGISESPADARQYMRSPPGCACKQVIVDMCPDNTNELVTMVSVVVEPEEQGARGQLGLNSTIVHHAFGV